MSFPDRGVIDPSEHAEGMRRRGCGACRRHARTTEAGGARTGSAPAMARSPGPRSHSSAVGRRCSPTRPACPLPQDAAKTTGAASGPIKYQPGRLRRPTPVSRHLCRPGARADHVARDRVARTAPPQLDWRLPMCTQRRDPVPAFQPGSQSALNNQPLRSGPGTSAGIAVGAEQLTAATSPRSAIRHSSLRGIQDTAQ